MTAGSEGLGEERRSFGSLPTTIQSYRVESVLGRGASGIVFRVRDDALDRSIALKLLTDDLDADARARFLIEAKAAARIIHPNVVQVFSVGSHEGRAFITQELVDGYPLSMLLEARGTLSPEAVVDIGLQVASGLQRAAEVGVLHRDVKPQNLLVTEDGTVKLADFGLAKILDAPTPSLTDTGTTLGTPHYMSPEQGLGLPLDPRADQYSLGATLYHLLTGHPPFDDDNAIALVLKHRDAPLVPVRDRRPDVPAPIAAVVERMLAKAREDRFESFEALIAALEDLDPVDEAHGEVRELLDGLERLEEPVAAGAPAPEPVEEEPRRRDWPMGVAIGIAALVIGFLGLMDHGRFGTTPAKGPPIREEVTVEVLPVRAAVAAPEPVAPKNDPRKRPTKADLLIEELRDPATAASAARELGRLGDHRATEALVRTLSSRSERIAIAAAEALGELGDIAALEPLAEAAEHGRTERIREAAEKAKARLWSVEE
jgi:serine/threonine-protein kinase